MNKEKIRNLLEKKKSKLEQDLRKILAEEVLEEDSWMGIGEIGEEAFENFEKLTKQEKVDLLENALRRVKQSLEDLNKNRYGTCNNCEQSIDEKRLEVYPEAQFCIKCKKDML